LIIGRTDVLLLFWSAGGVMADAFDIWREAEGVLRALGEAAPAELARMAEMRLREGEKRAAIRLRLIADACQTLLSESPQAGEARRCRA
jgi:hypothetical protein